MKVGICNEVFGDRPIEEVFAYIADLGYDGVEIAPFTLGNSPREISAARRREIRRAAEHHQLEVLGLHWLLVKPEGLSINDPDGEVRQRTQEHMRALIHLCADLGGRVLTHGSPNQRSIRAGWDPAEARQRAQQTFEAILPTAKERGCVYCIEPLTPADTNFINTVADAMDLVRAINHPSFQLMVDCRSATESEGDALQALKSALASGHLRHVHINDVNRRGPGFGQMTFTPILQALQDAEYRGYVSVEVFDFNPDPETIAARSIGYLRGILEGSAPA